MYRKRLRPFLTEQEMSLFNEIVESGEFEETHYRNAYDDIPKTLEGAVVHYMKIGRHEGRPATLDAIRHSMK